MEKLLDIVGASILWSFVLLIMIQVNSQMNDYSFESINNSVTQMDAVELSKIIEYDFPKAGALINGDKIIKADSNELKFYFDNNADGTKDSLYYYLGNTSELSSTYNPNDKPLYRKLNDTPYVVGSISDFKIRYLDSLGQEISYASLSSQVDRNKIEIFEIYFMKEGIFLNYDSLYPAVEWKREINPNNL
jgi:hypothetical protein